MFQTFKSFVDRCKQLISNFLIPANVSADLANDQLHATNKKQEENKKSTLCVTQQQKGSLIGVYRTSKKGITEQSIHNT